MKDPLVSVIIPSYNREKLIVKAIVSVMAQTLSDFEILVIDDASTDNTGKVIAGMNNEKIRYFRLEKNGGQCIARNYGIKQARGKYIAFLDSDDEWLPKKLELQVSCFENGPEELGCVYGYSYQTDVIKNKTILMNNGYQRGNIHHLFLKGFCPPTPSIFVVKKTALFDVGGFDEKLITFVDLDLWIRLSKNHMFDYVEEPLIIKYEQIGDQYINNFEKRYKGYGIFINKWNNELIAYTGKGGAFRFRKGLALALIVPLLEHPPGNLQRNAWKIIKLLVSIRSNRWKLYFKAVSILIFGPNVIYFVREHLKR